METLPLKLSDIRGALIRQEETIIFALIERSQFARNAACYKRGESDVLRKRVAAQANEGEPDGAGNLSFMEYFLVQTESLHAKLGRYSSPDENAFFAPMLPSSVLNGESKASPLKPNRININDEVLGVYTDRILDTLCGSNTGDDSEYGSTCACDIAVLQALSKRIHYGKFVAEAKFQAERARFSKMIEANDADGIMEALTNVAVEDSVIERVRLKASRYGTDGSAEGDDAAPAYKVQPDVIAQLYRDYLIPLNKKVQVEYLLERLERPSFAFFDENGSAELAAAQRFEDPGHRCESIEEVFLAISRNQVAFGLVPIQDSTRGFFKTTQRALLASGLKVCDCLVHGAKALTGEAGEGAWTRYYVVSVVGPEMSPAHSHLVCFFGVMHEPGSLVTALTALDGVNLSCLESIPHHSVATDGRHSQYAFFCEIEGRSLDHVSVDGVLAKLGSVTSFVQLVGAYSTR